MAQEKNTQTLIATFDNYSVARQAARELEESGVSSGSIQIDSNQKTAGAGSGGYQNQPEDHQETGFMGWWNSIFGSDHDGEERGGYEDALENGNAVLRATVPENSVDSAVDTLNRMGAEDIDRRSSSSSSQAGSVAGNGPIEVVEEELQVGKRSVRRGGVRVFSHLVSQPVQEQVNLREEHVNVERRQVDREISPEDVSALRDQTIEVDEMAEEAVVAKRARVREEVVIGKESTDRTETIRDNVRHTEIEIEQLGSESSGSSLSESSPVSQQSVGSASGSQAPRGLSPQSPAPSVLSGGGSTAGAGTLAGETTAGLTDFDLSSSYKQNFEQTYGSDSDFESMRPAYDYGYRTASQDRYRGKPWTLVESDLRSDYEQSNPGSSWEKAKDAIRHGWDKVTGQR